MSDDKSLEELFAEPELKAKLIFDSLQVAHQDAVEPLPAIQSLEKTRITTLAKCWQNNQCWQNNRSRK